MSYCADGHHKPPDFQPIRLSPIYKSIRLAAVIQVYCVAGGGASYLTRTLKPASYAGLDNNPDGIAYCRKRPHPAPVR